MTDGSAKRHRDRRLNAVDQAIVDRYSARYFLDKQVSRNEIAEILEIAGHAPSGANIQPWRVYVVGGEVKESLCTAISREYAANAAGHVSEYKYYTEPLHEPFLSRRKKFGEIFYGALDIEYSDLEARQRQTARNFQFFEAPVGLIFTINRRLEVGSWLDLGMFIQSFMVSAKGRGFDTCAQETWSKFHTEIRHHLPLSEEELVVCAVSLGFSDPGKSKTRGVQTRLRIDEFSQFFGF